MTKMGFFSTQREVEEAKMALVGRYVFERLRDREKEQVIGAANGILREIGYPKLIDDFEEKIQWMFWALALVELGFDHRLKSFKWVDVKDPFKIMNIEDAHWEAAANILNKKYRLNITYP